MPSSIVVTIVSTALVVAVERRPLLAVVPRAHPAAVATRLLWPGAIVGGIAWSVLQAVGGWLVARQLRHTSELYGTFGVVLGLLFFLYLAAQIIVYAAEVNVVRARHLVPRSLAPPPLTEADEAVLTDVVEAEQRRPEQDVDVEVG